MIRPANEFRGSRFRPGRIAAFRLAGMISLAVVFLSSPLLLGQTTRPGTFDNADIRRAGDPVLAPANPTVSPTKDFLDLSRVGIALLVVIGLIILLKWIARRFFGLQGSANAQRAVKMLGRTMITPRQHVLLLQVGRRVIVASDSNGQIASLAQITDPDEVAELVGQIALGKSGPQGRFGSLFGKAQDEFGPDQIATTMPVTTAAGMEEQDIAVEPALAKTRLELGGLMEKVRSLSQQFKK